MTDEHLEQMRSLAADWKAVKYTGSEDDYIVVATTDEAVSMWDRIESMQAAQITVGEVNELRAEIERLRNAGNNLEKELMKLHRNHHGPDCDTCQALIGWWEANGR